MPKIKRFLARLRSVPSSFLVVMAGIACFTLLLLSYYLHLIGSVSLPPALADLLSSLAKTGDKPVSQPMVVMPFTDPRSSAQFTFSGIQQPPTRSATEAGLAEDAAVIGVSFAGKARAYSIAAMSQGPRAHVINDMLAGHPVTVAYCNVMDCARVFTMNTSPAPLDLGVGGWRGEKGMILQVDGVKYALEDGKNLSTPDGSPLPYQQMDYQRTTWGEWHETHPDTDVYVRQPQTAALGG